MIRLILGISAALNLMAAAHAQTPEGVRLLTTLPPDLVSATTYYEQNVYELPDGAAPTGTGSARVESSGVGLSSRSAGIFVAGPLETVRSWNASYGPMMRLLAFSAARRR